MKRLDGNSRDWQQPAGVESRLMDDHGNVYANHCRHEARLRPEYFLKGTAPKATCAAGNQTVSPVKEKWLRRWWRR
jgi:hypothetical protein